MTGTHGDLFREIGELVVAAHAGEPIDLTEKAEELALRYLDLGVPADTIARAIARSIGAVGMSLAIIRPFERPRPAGEAKGPNGDASQIDAASEAGAPPGPGDLTQPASLFPSGVRLAVLS